MSRRYKTATLASRLRNKVELFQKVPTTNALDEDDYTYEKIKDVRVQILPLTANVEHFKDVEPTTKAVNATHRFIARYSIAEIITIDSYFMYQGLKYEVVSFMQDFQSRSYVDIKTVVRYE